MNWLRANWSRLTAGIAIAAVAGVTGVISYIHIYALTLVLYQPELVARLMPFGVDGLIIVGSVALLQANADRPWLGWLGVAPGVVISVFANVESGLPHGPLAATWAGVPAISFALSTYILERWLAGRPKPVLATPEPPEPPARPCGHEVAGTPEENVVRAYLHERDCLGLQPSQRRLAATHGLSRPKVAQLVGHLNGHGSPGA